MYSPADPHATALAVDDDRISWVGADDDAPTADTIIELDGALLAPAFVDAHAHLTNTGLTMTLLDVSPVRSAAQLLDAVAAHAATLPAGSLVYARGYDESTWPDPSLPHRTELENAVDGRPCYVSHISGHAALTTGALVAAVPGVTGMPGYGADGRHTLEAVDALYAAAITQLDAPTRHRAQQVALGAAAALGIGCVHECGGPTTSSETDFTELLAASSDQPVPQVVGYWGELGAASKARELGAAGAAGDLYADGALGSVDAHLSVPYADGSGCGHALLSAEEVAAHIVDCTGHGMQGGMHAIGDAAVATVLAGFAAAAEVVGIERLRAARHRVEHAEILDKTLIAGLVEFGLTASVQPAFDRLWGGAGQMYQQRLGLDRSLASNPFGSLSGVGVPLAFGSDSPVTPLDPWGGVRAAAQHHNPAQRISVRTAFAAHTRGGWRAARYDETGFLAPGAPATLAVWDCPAGLDEHGLPLLDEPDQTPRCLRTVRDGVTIFTA
ncbi:amidohydrolase [Actinocatenispora thailandica]